MRKVRLAAAFVAAFVLYSGSSHAVIIEFEIANLAGSQYQIDYTVTNDDQTSGLESFSIYFDRDVYSNLSVNGSPAGWDSIVFQPDPGLPSDGVFDSLATSGALSIDDVLGGFSVLFDWTGVGQLGTQAFDIFDPNSFERVGFGSTIAFGSVPVSEPATAAVFLLGIGCLAFARRRRRSSSPGEPISEAQQQQQIA